MCWRGIQLIYLCFFFNLFSGWSSSYPAAIAACNFSNPHGDLAAASSGERLFFCLAQSRWSTHMSYCKLDAYSFGSTSFVWGKWNLWLVWGQGIKDTVLRTKGNFSPLLKHSLIHFKYLLMCFYLVYLPIHFRKKMLMTLTHSFNTILPFTSLIILHSIIFYS